MGDERQDASGAGGRLEGDGHRPVQTGEPDVLLEVPHLKVDELTLDVEDLRANVALQARVLDLLGLDVGADVALDRVGLTIKGLEAQVLLKVRLDNVAAILDRVMTTIERNPVLLEHLAQGASRAVEEVATGAGDAVSGVGRGVGSAVENVGSGAGALVEEVGVVGESRADGAAPARNDERGAAGEARAEPPAGLAAEDPDHLAAADPDSGRAG